MAYKQPLAGSTFKMMGSSPAKQKQTDSTKKTMKTKPTYVPKENWAEKQERKLAGLSNTKSESNKAANWYMMEKGAKQDYYKNLYDKSLKNR